MREKINNKINSKFYALFRVWNWEVEKIYFLHLEDGTIAILI